MSAYLESAYLESAYLESAYLESAYLESAYLESAMLFPHLLSVGYDPLLMRTRSLLLRQAGFSVDEAYNLNGALGLLKTDSIDAVLLCHTIPKDKQHLFIAAARGLRRLLPIICIQAHDHDGRQQGCVSVGSDPVELLEAIKLAAIPPEHSGK
jgi:CheY-like chemotaxis protein